MEHEFSRCENCEFLINNNNMPECILQNKNVGILHCCDKYKERTGEHITF